MLIDKTVPAATRMDQETLYAATSAVSTTQNSVTRQWRAPPYTNSIINNLCTVLYLFFDGIKNEAVLIEPRKLSSLLDEGSSCTPPIPTPKAGTNLGNLLLQPLPESFLVQLLSSNICRSRTM